MKQDELNKKISKENEILEEAVNNLDPDRAIKHLKEIDKDKKYIADDFPMKAVKHLARSNCNCHQNGFDVVHNKHYDCCMVGQAQKYLGIKVGHKSIYGEN